MRQENNYNTIGNGHFYNRHVKDNKNIKVTNFAEGRGPTYA